MHCTYIYVPVTVFYIIELHFVLKILHENNLTFTLYNILCIADLLIKIPLSCSIILYIDYVYISHLTISIDPILPSPTALAAVT